MRRRFFRLLAILTALIVVCLCVAVCYADDTEVDFEGDWQIPTWEDDGTPSFSDDGQTYAFPLNAYPVMYACTSDDLVRYSSRRQLLISAGFAESLDIAQCYWTLTHETDNETPLGVCYCNSFVTSIEVQNNYIGYYYGFYVTESGGQQRNIFACVSGEVEIQGDYLYIYDERGYTVQYWIGEDKINAGYNDETFDSNGEAKRDVIAGDVLVTLDFAADNADVLYPEKEAYVWVALEGDFPDDEEREGTYLSEWDYFFTDDKLGDVNWGVEMTNSYYLEAWWEEHLGTEFFAFIEDLMSMLGGDDYNNLSWLNSINQVLNNFGTYVDSMWIGTYNNLKNDNSFVSQETVNDLIIKFVPIVVSFAYGLAVIIYVIGFSEKLRKEGTVFLEKTNLRRFFKGLLLLIILVSQSIIICKLIIALNSEIVTMLLGEGDFDLNVSAFKVNYTQADADAMSSDGLWIFRCILGFFKVLLTAAQYVLVLLVLIIMLAILSIKLYIRQFELAVLTILSPLFMSFSVSEITENWTKNFIKSFVSVVVETLYMSCIFLIGREMWTEAWLKTNWEQANLENVFPIEKLFVLFAILICMIKIPRPIKAIIPSWLIENKKKRR